MIKNWDDVKQDIRYRFQDKEQLKSEMWMDFQVAQLFNGQYNPKTHIEQCVRQWKVVEIPYLLRVQVFPHSLGMILEACYIHEETKRKTSNSKMSADQFCKDLSFTSKYPELKIVLQKNKNSFLLMLVSENQTQWYVQSIFKCFSLTFT
jgi:hypothetical protein